MNLMIYLLILTNFLIFSSKIKPLQKKIKKLTDTDNKNWKKTFFEMICDKDELVETIKNLVKGNQFLYIYKRKLNMLHIFIIIQFTDAKLKQLL